MTRVVKSRAEHLLIAAFLGAAAFAASAITSMGQPETQLTVKSRGQAPAAAASAGQDTDSARQRMQRRS